jgi:hypothetical protein
VCWLSFKNRKWQKQKGSYEMFSLFAKSFVKLDPFTPLTVGIHVEKIVSKYFTIKDSGHSKHFHFMGEEELLQWTGNPFHQFT